MEWSPRRLQQWLSECISVDGQMSIVAIEGAISNENYSIDWGYHRWLLRKMPAVLSHQSAHNVLREYRILKALEGTAVRSPKTVIACDDRNIIGTPFFIMERVDGLIIDRLLPPSYGISNDCVDFLAVDMINAIATLHSVDWRKNNLADIGKFDGSLEQQVRRWQAQHQLQSAGSFSPIMELSSWLFENCPTDHDVTIIHGDYQLNNMIVSQQPPARLLAVIDWELTTLGDPLIDLASVLLSWPAKDNTYANRLLAGGRPQKGTACFEQLALQYTKATGRKIDSLNYYLVLAAWKRSIVLESRYESHNNNDDKTTMTSETLDNVKTHILILLEQAYRYIKQPIRFK